MNREIKFRAWVEIGDNSEIKGMVQEVVPYGSSNDGNIGAFTDSFNDAIKPSGYQYSENEFIPDDNTKERIDGGEFNVSDIDGDWIFFEGELMQFTGTLDKNKKEAYEGDIVINEDGDKRLIKWAMYGFEMRLLNGLIAESGTIWHFQFEIIGNIYSNPDLLK